MARGDRQHSRGGPAGGHAARSGAGQLGADGQPDAAQEEDQAFSRPGQFTGRDVPPPDPADLEAAADAFRRAAAASPPPSADEIAGAPGDTAASTAHASPGDLSELEAMARERDQFRSDLQRLAADFENFRKRAIRERELAATAADARLLGELLAVLDDFERALEHAAGAEPGTPHAQLADGIRMTHARLLGVLQQHGLTEISADGQFDPHLHEAMMMQPAPAGVAPGSVLQVVQKGYMLGERPLRHAKVIVAGDD